MVVRVVDRAREGASEASREGGSGRGGGAAIDGGGARACSPKASETKGCTIVERLRFRRCSTY